MDELGDILRRFYAEVRQKNGAPYSKSGLINIRSSIQRHLSSPPYNVTFNIQKDAIFNPANQIIQGTIKMMKQQGLDKTKHKEAINQTDMRKIRDSLNTETPQGLQDTVFLDVVLHFARRGREGLREMSKTSISVRQDAKGIKYATPAYNEFDKNHTGVNPKIKDPKKVMYAEGGDNCPVTNLEKYLQKLNPKCDAFFQRPKVNYIKGGIWYDNMPVGKNTLAGKISKLSQAAGCSEIYTNHCLRATATTVLSHAGVSPTDICSVTGHSSVESLKHYVSGPSMEQRANMSHILHQYGRPAAPQKNKPCTITSTHPGPSHPGPSHPASPLTPIIPTSPRTPSIPTSPKPGPSSSMTSSPPNNLTISIPQSPPSSINSSSMHVENHQTLNQSALRSILSGNHFHGNVNFYFK